ncbi:stress responsive protein [Labrys okinawensis]|uniref:Stress responsive protein n=1 Tax=Labrys okinawensis TaxID=346911 RepID=A0A2S9QEW3_9HYPH|nr:Dabb family protein [Labrys okinawensis]PRH87884.1 stress responsive protein [Labrys okinawensis]
MIRHIVLARLRTDLPQAETEALQAAIRGMKTEIPGILQIAVGADNSPEGLARGYGHAFTVDFVDASARDAYLPHPHHAEVAKALVAATQGGVDGLLVLDFEA